LAQSTGADSARNAKIEISANGSSWTDISGAANTVTTTGGARPTAESNTFDGDNPITTAGKAGAVDIAVAFVYTEGGSDPFETVRAIWDGTNVIYVRWSPKGGQTGEFVFTAGPGVISNFVYPNGDAGSAAALVSGFTYHGPRPVKSVAA
jgi:hypothetical protein